MSKIKFSQHWESKHIVAVLGSMNNPVLGEIKVCGIEKLDFWFCDGAQNKLGKVTINSEATLLKENDELHPQLHPNMLQWLYKDETLSISPGEDGRGGGSMASISASYSEDPSSVPADY